MTKLNDLPGFPEAVGKDWEEEYRNEFLKAYQGILENETIAKSIQWHIDFIKKYIPLANLEVVVDEHTIMEVLLKSLEEKYDSGINIGRDVACKIMARALARSLPRILTVRKGGKR